MEYTDQKRPNEYVRLLLEKVLEREGFKKGRIDIKPLGAKGDNYLGVLLSAEVVESENNNKKSLNLVIKIAVEDEKMRDIFQTVSTFSSETLMYKEILPLYNDIQIAANINENVRFKFAKCYEADTTLRHECIILEDLRTKGYAMEDRLKTISYVNAKMVIQTLSKYHALSFVFRDKYEDQYRSVVERMSDFYGIAAKIDSFIRYFKQSMDRAALTVEDDEKTKLLNATDKIIDMFISSRAPWDKRGCVIAHNDSWINNILLQNMNGTTNNAILIDFQMIKHTSPVVDLLFFIFVSSDSQFRAEYYEHLKNIYYESLKSFLNDLGYDVAKFYTRDEMERHILEYAPYVLGSSCLIMLLISVEIEDVTGIGENICELKGQSAKNYEKRISELIRDFIKFKLI